MALFQPCLDYAVGLGFDVAFTPHLDDGLNNGQWRNAMLINPLQKYRGMSYTDFVLKPLADVMAATIREKTKVRRLAGERACECIWLYVKRGVHGRAGRQRCAFHASVPGLSLPPKHTPPPHPHPRCGLRCRARCLRW